VKLLMNHHIETDSVNARGKADKPHAVNFIGNYKFSHRFSTSVNINYNTERPITLPIAQYMSNGTARSLYEERNPSRIQDYFRIDLSLNIEGNYKIRKLSSWTVGVYNLLGCKNPYFCLLPINGQRNSRQDAFHFWKSDTNVNI